MEKIILVHYINVGNSSPERVHRLMEELQTMLMRDEDSNLIKHFIYPVKDQETRVECINPKLVSEEEYKTAKEVLKRNQKVITRLLSEKMGI